MNGVEFRNYVEQAIDRPLLLPRPAHRVIRRSTPIRRQSGVERTCHDHGRADVNDPEVAPAGEQLMSV
ncbi:MAG TPA: hypothetical protein VK137_07065, partial [Planctomycetaceae bacterium]|nr:hypothetical protein [Planctomycetaceae bacterium]